MTGQVQALNRILQNKDFSLVELKRIRNEYSQRIFGKIKSERKYHNYGKN